MEKAKKIIIYNRYNKIDISRSVYDLVQKITPGKVMTYGSIAKNLNIGARQVGRILHINIEPIKTPCHRVVNSRGEVAANYAFGGGDVQKQKLMAEGVLFKNGRVDLPLSMYLLLD